jgi:RNA polymerase sigma factor (sigma-70 family)
MAPPSDDTSDFDLIGRMAGHQADFAEARYAWGKFYVRHYDSLILMCTGKFGYLLGVEEVNDLVQQAFHRAFDGATGFDYTEACEPLVQKHKCRKWLARIVENLFRDRFRGQPQVCFVDHEDLERLSDTQGKSADTQAPQSTRLKVLESGFELLSDIEQAVLRATMFWWNADQDHQRMPHAAIEQLSRQIGKSPATIRQIRSRAMEKLQKYVNENLHNEKAE